MSALPAELEAAVQEFAQRGRVLVATDFDGVLAPLVLDPATSRPQPGTIDALRGMAALSDVVVAVASGRDLATLRQLTGITEADGIVLIGSHGAQSNRPAETGLAADTEMLTSPEAAALSQISDAVVQLAAENPGASVEHKPAGVVLHTRGMDPVQERATSQAARALADDVPGVHVMAGKAVTEFSVLDVSKGAALEALAGTRKAEASLYLGDDVTDETVFTSARGEYDVTVKVGGGDTAARYRVSSCTDVPAVLALALGELSRRPRASTG